MSTFFVDTSALAKRYFSEPGSAWVNGWITASAGMLTMKDGNLLAKDFNVHTKTQYRVIPLKKRLLNRAKNLVIKHPLRTLDAIQLASAMVAAQTLNLYPVFISGDQRLLSAAMAEGFTIDSPYSHP